tara:strand:+ start:2745 stop:4949 length:2205 start_codon:yes stop_codon:yes gene_type:complete
MAKRIKVGEPVNAAETWAFKFLETNLPTEYMLITNVEVPTPNGLLKEIDAIVFGKYAVYLVDVKGYSGTLNVDANSWVLDGRIVDNALSKANGVARVYAGGIKANLLRAEHAPWCQGMVFVTGDEGSEITLNKAQPNLSVFDAGSIIQGLTKKEYCTNNYQFIISQSQRKKALDVLGDIGKVPAKISEVGGFKKIEKLSAHGRIQIWQAEHAQGELVTRWLLHEVDTTSKQSSEAIEKLKDHAARLEQLSGVLGVPVSTPLIRNSGYLSFAIREVLGTPLPDFLDGQVTPEKTARVIRFAATSIEQISARGLSLSCCKVSDILVTEELELIFNTDFIQGKPESAASSLRRLFFPLSAVLNNAEVSTWFDDQENQDLESLTFYLSAIITGKSLDERSGDDNAEVFSGKYGFDRQISSSQFSEIWLGHHKDGQFECVIEKVFQAESRWAQAQPLISRLMSAFHPSLERVFDVDYSVHEDIYAVSRGLVVGERLDVAIVDVDNSTVLNWLRQAIQALQYLHRLGLCHRRLRPSHIICSLERCVLVGISILPTTEVGNKDSITLAAHIRAELNEDTQDLVALWMSFLVSYLDCKPENLNSHIDSAKLKGVLNDTVIVKLKSFLANPSNFDLSLDYRKGFGLDDVKRITEIPVDLANEWSISRGYMTFIVLDLLNDQRPKSRNQIVLSALRSRHISGNKTNKSSMSATVSRLKSAGVAEDYGKKIRLTASFVAAWNSYS